MDKLKTLKDFGVTAMKIESPYQQHFYTEKLLKEIAKNWVLKNKGVNMFSVWAMFHNSFTDEEWNKKCEGWKGLPALIAIDYLDWWIKHFFNIV